MQQNQSRNNGSKIDKNSSKAPSGRTGNTVKSSPSSAGKGAQSANRGGSGGKGRGSESILLLALTVIACAAVITTVILAVLSVRRAHPSYTDTTSAITDIPTGTVTEPPVSAVTTASLPAVTTVIIPATTPAVTTSSEPSPSSPAILAKTADGGDEYLSRITFLGDSTTYGLAVYRMLDGGRQTTQVWAPSSGTLAMFDITTKMIYYPELEKEILIADAVKEKQPDILIITLGLNFYSEITDRNKNYFISEYTKLIDLVKKNSPETKIILQSIFPTLDGVATISNDTVEARNEWVIEVAESCGVKYLDTHSAIVDENGSMKAEYENKADGYHFNELGYAAELEYIRTHMYPDSGK